MELISKQAAIDVAMQDVSCIRTHEFNAGATRAANRIKQLLPAEPQIIRCKDCKRRRTDGYCTRFQININGIATRFFMPEEDDFCSKAKRRIENETD